ncbi:hypothetical protein F3Y22_tig00111238pilonHSYRG00005 [Hibiscus syriacus]|uniref:Cyclin-dependent protein kinase inhibitor SMR2 n=1 Tax=Hibiscus syriacus TaxID=106335 RepID=A0A6A2YTR2_HIBSY|nr:hypothetical protein F3Y22_tig00111238pilonHSYRG00005 [Hibiscus syriacus]
MSKDHHENILQEALQKLEEHQQEGKGGGLGAREADEEEAKEKEECKTPTSSDHKIPSIQSCPPTPKKKVRADSVLKRKLSELQFFETTRRDEVESFFRSNTEPFSFKRRCRSA